MSENKVKKSLEHKGLEIRLYETIPRKDIPHESISNIISVDSTGKIVWKAETPKSHYDQYWDIEIDSAKNVLIAITALSFRHVIDLNNGRIIESSLLK